MFCWKQTLTVLAKLGFGFAHGSPQAAFLIGPPGWLIDWLCFSAVAAIKSTKCLWLWAAWVLIRICVFNLSTCFSFCLSLIKAAAELRRRIVCWDVGTAKWVWDQNGMCRWPLDLCFVQFKQILDAATWAIPDTYPVINLGHISASLLPTRGYLGAPLCFKSVINRLPLSRLIVHNHPVIQPRVYGAQTFDLLCLIRLDSQEIWLTRSKPVIDHPSTRQLLCVCFLQRPTVNQGMWRGGWASCERPLSFRICFSAVWSELFMHIYFEGKVTVGFNLKINAWNLESLNFSYLELTYKQKLLFVCFCWSAILKCNKYRKESFLKNRFVTRIHGIESNKHILCIHFN